MMAKRVSASDAPRLEEFVNACIVLDDWLHWMSSFCGVSEASEAFSDDQSYLSPYRILSHLSTKSERWQYTFQYLDRLSPYVVLAIEKWSPLLTPNEGQQPVQGKPLAWRPEAEISVGMELVRAWFPFPHYLAYPTAHELVCDCLDQFVNSFVKAIETTKTLDFSAMKLGTTDSVLQWNSDEVSRLRACLGQERSWLGSLLKGSGLGDDYRTKWRPYTPEALSLLNGFDESMEAESKILDALLQNEPLTQLELSHSADQGNPPSGTFKAAIKRLSQSKLILSGGPGKASKGYFLTPLGCAVALNEISLLHGR